MTRAILFLSVILPTICNAQPPLPFPTGDAHWTVNSVDMGNSFPDRIYATMGDTLINGILYEKLGWVENTGLPFDPVDLTYYGSIHDEDGRWLYIPSGDNSEYTLYDFTGVQGPIDHRNICCFGHQEVVGPFPHHEFLVRVLGRRGRRH